MQINREELIHDWSEHERSTSFVQNSADRSSIPGEGRNLSLSLSLSLKPKGYQFPGGEGPLMPSRRTDFRFAISQRNYPWNLIKFRWLFVRFHARFRPVVFHRLLRFSSPSVCGRTCFLPGTMKINITRDSLGESHSFGNIVRVTESNFF